MHFNNEDIYSAMMKRDGLQMIFDSKSYQDIRGGAEGGLDRVYRAHFGQSWQVHGRMWALLQLFCPHDFKIKPKHLHWSAYFCKNYTNESTMASFCKCTEKTLRKWVWIMMECISEYVYPHVVRLFLYFLYFFI